MSLTHGSDPHRVVLSAQVLGCAALFGTILPFVELPFPAQTQAHSYSRDVRIPFVKVPVLGHGRGPAAENAGTCRASTKRTAL